MSYRNPDRILPRKVKLALGVGAGLLTLQAMGVDVEAQGPVSSEPTNGQPETGQEAMASPFRVELGETLSVVQGQGQIEIEKNLIPDEPQFVLRSLGLLGTEPIKGVATNNSLDYRQVKFGSHFYEPNPVAVIPDWTLQRSENGNIFVNIDDKVAPESPYLVCVKHRRVENHERCVVVDYQWAPPGKRDRTDTTAQPGQSSNPDTPDSELPPPEDNPGEKPKPWPVPQPTSISFGKLQDYHGVGAKRTYQI
jgi:hypothetical protein